MIYRRGILSVSRGKHNRGIEYSFPPFKTSIPIIAFRGHSYRFRPNPKAIVLGGNEPFFIGERRLVAGVIHRQIKASLLANVRGGVWRVDKRAEFHRRGIRMKRGVLEAAQASRAFSRRFPKSEQNSGSGIIVCSSI